MNYIYAFYDNVAQAIPGNHLYLFKHDAAAIRFYSDVARTKDTMINQHVADFDLIRLGVLNEKEIHPAYEVILQGNQWLAAQENDSGA